MLVGIHSIHIDEEIMLHYYYGVTILVLSVTYFKRNSMVVMFKVHIYIVEPMTLTLTSFESIAEYKT
jgi:hypothetical protein